MKLQTITGAIAASLIVVGSLAYAPSTEAAPVIKTSLTRNCSPLSPGISTKPQISPGPMSEATYKQIQAAQIAMGNGAHADAEAILQPLLAKAAGKKYLEAIVHQNLGYAAAGRDNYKKAASHFLKAVSTNALPYDAQQDSRYYLASLYANDGDFPKAVDMIRAWFKNSIEPKAAAYTLLANSYVQMKQYRNAACPMYYAIEMAEKRQKSYYSTYLAIHWELEDFQGTADILRQMINWYPEDKVYWTQLVSLYLKLDQSDNALAVAELGYKAGLWDKQEEFVRLAQLYQFENIPYSAANVMSTEMERGRVEKSLKHWRFVASSYHLAQELDEALAAYDQVARLSDTGETYLRIGNINTEKEDWAAAEAGYKKAVAKGGLDASKTGRAYLNMGIAQYYQGKMDAAIATLQRASNYDATSKNSTSWIAFIEGQRKAREAAQEVAAGE